jgi:hypothetical protein
MGIDIMGADTPSPIAHHPSPITHHPSPFVIAFCLLPFA